MCLTQKADSLVELKTQLEDEHNSSVACARLQEHFLLKPFQGITAWGGFFLGHALCNWGNWNILAFVTETCKSAAFDSTDPNDFTEIANNRGNFI